MHWFFPYFDYCSPVRSNCNLKFSSILQILQNKLARFFFLLILGLQLTICCAILTGSNWTKDGKSTFFRLYLSVSKMMLLLIFRLNLFLLLQFIPKNLRSQSFKYACYSFKIKPGKCTLHYRGSSVWNSISVDYRCNLSSTKLHSLKSLLT